MKATLMSIIVINDRNMSDTNNIIRIARLIQFSDSACPVGTFAFSCGLESAAASNLVSDSRTLKEFAKSTARQSAFCDGIAAIHAHRAASKDNFDDIALADHSLFMAKMNEEARKMLCRMGGKLAELGNGIYQSPILTQVVDNIKKHEMPGTYPVVQGAFFASLGISEEEMFYSHQYGVINMVLSAALRCVRVSHIDTQKILFELMNDTHSIYEQAKGMSLDDMHAFCPELDIMASLHEKGSQRMFMS